MDELFGGLLGAAEIVVVVLMIRRWGIAGTWERLKMAITPRLNWTLNRLMYGQPSRHDRALARIAELERELGIGGSSRS